MCTASWLKQDKQFDLFFNRDEARTRGIASPPAMLSTNGVTYIAPRDADFGGTWLAANEFGLVLCLLNNYQSAAGLLKDYFSKFESRGGIIPALITSANIAECRQGARKLEPQKYRPFVLAAFHNGASFTFSWDGKVADFGEPELPLISSAFSYQVAKKNRGGLFLNQGELTPEKLLALHRSHLPHKGELSICMHRAEAQTVSLTHVSIGGGEVAMEYFAGNPCETPQGVITTIARRQ